MKNDIWKGKRLDFGAEPARINICWVPPGVSHASSVWNFFVRFSDIVSWANQLWCRKMWAFFLIREQSVFSFPDLHDHCIERWIPDIYKKKPYSTEKHWWYNLYTYIANPNLLIPKIAAELLSCTFFVHVLGYFADFDSSITQCWASTTRSR